ncbi:MAG: indole-3-glycerol phosphate synthase TrpC [Blastocatellia bacterium]|nr:indole-3-glycerol phosphate synthase TrpC [Blastocatellia bacterium]
MNDILERIVSRKRERLNEAKKGMPFGELLATMPTSFGTGRFTGPLQNMQNGGIKVIAEIKKRSPSKGVIRENFEPAAIARNYAANGAVALSVLTEEDFFDGSLDFLRIVDEVTDRPLLRKDFIIDQYQIYEAAHAGADAILLIVALLDVPQLNDLLQMSYGLGLDALVEVHDLAEVERAMKCDVRLLGVNNRNLRTFETRIETSLDLAGQLPESITLVSESGIRTREDIERLRAAGYHAFLIGEELLRASDEGKALRELIS